MSITVPRRKLQESFLKGQGVQLSKVLPAGLPKPGEEGEQSCEKHDSSGHLLVTIESVRLEKMSHTDRSLTKPRP